MTYMSNTTQTSDPFAGMRRRAGIEFKRWDGNEDDPEIVGTITQRIDRDKTWGDGEGTYAVLTIHDADKDRNVEVRCIWRLEEMVEQYDPQPGDQIAIKWWSDEQSKKNEKLIKNYTFDVCDKDFKPKEALSAVGSDTTLIEDLKATASTGDEPGDAAKSEDEESDTSTDKESEPF